MKLKDFLSDKLLYIFLDIAYIAFIYILLSVIKLNKYAIFFIIFLFVIVTVVPMIFEYLKKKIYYDNIEKSLNNLDKKYLISEMIKLPDFCEGNILYETLNISNKSMNDNIAVYKKNVQDYMDYVETWVHEIKTPISSAKLIIENNKNETTLSIEEELDKIDKFVEQALYYSRSNNVEKDYIINKVNLKKLIVEFLKDNSKWFIISKVGVEIESLDFEVYTDKKWLNFILAQIMSNSIKYKANKINIYAKKNQENVILYVKDNGIGIEEKDIKNVFGKGFTGTNGRKYSKSTGMGLYLCKKLCKKLGLSINISSNINEGTTICIIFPKSSMYNA